MSNFRPASGFNASDFVLAPNRNSSYRFEPYSISLKRNFANQSLSVSTLLAYIDKIGLQAGVVNTSILAVETVTANKFLTAAESGKTILLGTIAAGISIVLPGSPPLGTRYEVRQITTPGGANNWSVSATDLNSMFGLVLNSVSVLTGTTVNGNSIATFSQNPAIGVIGDYLKFTCVGTAPVRWHVEGLCRNSNGVTFI